MKKIVREHSEYTIPVYLDEDGNYWIKLHLPSVTPQAGDGHTVWQRISLFNGDQIELLGTYFAGCESDVLTINVDKDYVLFENELFVI